MEEKNNSELSPGALKEFSYALSESYDDASTWEEETFQPKKKKRNAMTHLTPKKKKRK